MRSMTWITTALVGTNLFFTLQAAAADRPVSALAQKILDASGVQGGLIVHLGCGGGQLTTALRANERFIVHGLDANPANVTRARAQIAAQGLAGEVAADTFGGKSLPYVSDLVNLLVAEDLGGVPMEEVLRVLAPLGVAYIKEGAEWSKSVKAWPKDIDEWTHYLHGPDNNAVAHDRLVGPPKGLQWVAGPLYCRSHEIDSSVSALVSARGRIFYIIDEGPMGVIDKRFPQKWALAARDAFNGVDLWKVPLPDWGWPEWKGTELKAADWMSIRANRLRIPDVLTRRLVCDGERVFVTLGYHAPVSVLDGVTGKTVRTFAGTEDTDEILYQDGVLLVCLRQDRLPQGSLDEAKNRTGGGRKGKKKQAEPAIADPAPANRNRLIAIQADTGKTLWEHKAGQVASLCLAIAGKQVYYHNFSEVVCLDLKTGQPKWRTPSEAGKGTLFAGPNTLVVQNGVVLVNTGELQAFAVPDGKKLWAAKASKGPGISSAPDLFVASGLVWSGLNTDGRDPMTGAIRKKVDLQKLINPWHHYRCYRSKATDRYLIWPKQGAEFIDLESNDNMRNDWFRGPCKYGIMPCNGLIYAAPHQCSCFAGVKLNGFNALTARRSDPIPKPDAQPRFQTGPAFISHPETDAQPAAADWPTFRADAKRSGHVAATVPAQLAPVWQARLAGKLSQPIISGDKLLVASVDAGQVLCLDPKNGQTLWSFSAGGRVDSPPTIHAGQALFGSADGWVYCLRLSDGTLAWRLRAAPAERFLASMGQVESVWPVHGTVLVQNGIAYVAAGRSTFLDGGIFLTAFHPVTGSILNEARLEGPWPDVTRDDGGSRDMQGARTDVLVGDGSAVYLRQVKFDKELKLQGGWTTEALGKGMPGLRLTATSDLLDDSHFNRTSWHYEAQWSSSQGGGKSGQLLVFNPSTTYFAQVYSKHVAQSDVYFPGENFVRLFAARNPGLEPAAPAKKKKQAAAKEEAWDVTIPIFVRAMALADKTLFVAGFPDALDPKDPLGALEGRMGALLCAYSSENGARLSELKLEAAPVFDGVIAAQGRLFVSLTDGRLLCLGGK